MRQPYLDAPTERGALNFSAARIAQFVGWAYSTEDPLAVHAIGDAAIDFDRADDFIKSKTFGKNIAKIQRQASRQRLETENSEELAHARIEFDELALVRLDDEITGQ